MSVYDVSGGFVPRGVTVPRGRKGWRCVMAPAPILHSYAYHLAVVKP